MRLAHGLGLVACEISQLDRQIATANAVTARGGEQEADVGEDELVGILTRGAEVKELEFARGRVVEEIGPVGVGLHVFELSDFAEAQPQDLCADPVPVGLGEALSFGDADAFHALHGEDLRTGCFVVNGGDDEDVLLIMQECAETLGCIGFTDIIALPCKLHPGILNRLVQIQSFG